MGIIQILDDRLANMIAAGEVVERPASVVKELVENAIDAGSTRIEVYVEEGGLSLIKVLDDGCGIDREDCLVCFERHATSKIKRERDLFHISTLGFRGEALPSIAAVSKVELKSCRQTGETGTKIVVEGGQRISVESVAHPQGTEVTVRDLFYNTPARYKYLKSMQTEVGHIADYMNRLALSYPQISFLLVNDGRTLLKTYGDGQLLHVIAAVYGTAMARDMLAIEAENLDFKLYGYLGHPQLTRANRSYMSTLVNGRYVRHPGLAGAILRGYHTLLPVHRYPVCVLQLSMEPSLLDVNVHPAKLEVRFSKEQELLAFVEAEIRKALGRQRLIPEPIRQRNVEQSTQTRIDFGELMASRGSSKLNAPPVSSSASQIKEYTSWFLSGAEEEKQRMQLSVREPDLQPAIPAVDPPLQVPASGPVSPEPEPRVEEDCSAPELPYLYPLAQLHGTYILAQNEDGLYIIDQHAAQERIWYEYFLNKLREEQVEMQELLVPLSLDLSVSEMKQIEEKLPLFHEVGLDLEPFGTQSFLIRSHPRWFTKGEEENIIHEMVDMIIRGEEKLDTAKLREKAAITMACKAAIKANRHLNHMEMEALLNQLRQTLSPYTCPHGRPIVIHFSTYEIEKMFKRVM